MGTPISELHATLTGSVRAPKGPPCAVCLLLRHLDDDGRADLTALLSDEKVPYSDIAAGMQNLGHGDIDRGTYARHSRGRCQEMRRQGLKLRGADS